MYVLVMLLMLSLLSPSLLSLSCSSPLITLCHPKSTLSNVVKQTACSLCSKLRKDGTNDGMADEDDTDGKMKNYNKYERV